MKPAQPISEILAKKWNEPDILEAFQSGVFGGELFQENPNDGSGRECYLIECKDRPLVLDKAQIFTLTGRKIKPEKKEITAVGLSVKNSFSAAHAEINYLAVIDFFDVAGNYKNTSYVDVKLPNLKEQIQARLVMAVCNKYLEAEGEERAIERHLATPVIASNAAMLNNPIELRDPEFEIPRWALDTQIKEQFEVYEREVDNYSPTNQLRIEKLLQLATVPEHEVFTTEKPAADVVSSAKIVKKPLFNQH